MSVRTSIIDLLIARLEGIDGTGAYTNSVAEVLPEPADPNNQQLFPFLYVNENREVYEQGPIQSPAGFLSRRLGFVVGGWITDAAAPARASALLLADTELALLSGDHSLGGLAVDIILLSNEMVADTNRPDLSGFFLEAEVWYRTRHNDPNSAS